MARLATTVHLSQLGALEFRNALHLALFRGELSAADAAFKKRLFLEHMANGISSITPVPDSALFPRSCELADLR